MIIRAQGDFGAIFDSTQVTFAYFARWPEYKKVRQLSERHQIVGTPLAVSTSFQKFTLCSFYAENLLQKLHLLCFIGKETQESNLEL